jgi:hypothetical protein
MTSISFERAAGYYDATRPLAPGVAERIHLQPARAVYGHRRNLAGITSARLRQTAHKRNGCGQPIMMVWERRVAPTETTECLPGTPVTYLFCGAEGPQKPPQVNTLPTL